MAMFSVRTVVRILSAISIALLIGCGVYYYDTPQPASAAKAAAPAIDTTTGNSPPSSLEYTGSDGVPSLAPLVAKVTDAVVNVAVKSTVDVDFTDNPFFQDPMFRRFFGIPNKIPPEERMAAGSGVIVDAKNGYVITNFHVVDKATDITVTLKDRREFTAKLIGSDKGTDIAVLQIAADNLKSLPIGDSNGTRVGDYVIAVGNPFGLGQTVTYGIVSALGRSGLNIEGYEDFIQTDASINPGNSGGALVNLKGELIGINTAIIGPSGGNVGIGFAVPTAMAQGVMDQLIKYGKVTRGLLGVEVQNVTPDLAKNLGLDQWSGALITKVEKDSAAASAGLKAGDVVIAVNTSPIESAAALRNRIGLMPVGTSVDITILRDGTKKKIKATIGKAPTDETGGATMQHPNLEGANFANGKAVDGTRGVRIIDVAPDSPAWRIGLRPNDVIMSVNRAPVATVEDFEAALKSSSHETVLIINRDGEEILFVV